ncbi:protein TUNICAMYCIN INDUCED 1 [Magnolia sinica]|uniref:protein TUNICAMYCIN INDUCED 1 n=1 Tax=Magnolia sinica TaxID=86752 RepID=UPI002658B592|nr:protein TUNICAMYCIN INDUCED 1 [Magnolia sinica]
MQRIPLLLAISLILFSSLQSLPLSTPLYASNLTSAIEYLPSPHFLYLKDVLKAISTRQGWNLDEIKVSDVDIRKARVGSSERYEFHLRIGKSDLVFKFSDEISFWEKLRIGGEFGPHLISGSGLKKPVIKGFELVGPVELRVEGEDELSLALSLNITHSGLKRVLVSEGITVEVEGAQEVTLVHPSNFGFPVNGSLGINKARSPLWPFGNSACTPLLTIHIVGSASLVAYRTRNPSIAIETNFLSQDMVELLPDKCYAGHSFKNSTCPIHSLSSRLALLERLLRSFLGDRILQNRASGFLKSKIMASTLVRFQLELERDLGNNNTLWETLASWRTRPKVERVWFEVVARLEGGRLKPIMLKKVMPFVEVDTTAWSNLMSNVSFTQFPSVVLPPEALTLDVKW